MRGATMKQAVWGEARQRGRHAACPLLPAPPLLSSPCACPPHPLPSSMPLLPSHRLGFQVLFSHPLPPPASPTLPSLCSSISNLHPCYSLGTRNRAPAQPHSSSMEVALLLQAWAMLHAPQCTKAKVRCGDTLGIVEQGKEQAGGGDKAVDA